MAAAASPVPPPAAETGNGSPVFEESPPPTAAAADSVLSAEQRKLPMKFQQEQPTPSAAAAAAAAAAEVPEQGVSGSDAGGQPRQLLPMTSEGEEAEETDQPSPGVKDPKQGTPWSEEERQRLKQAVMEQRLDWTQVAEFVGRSKASCRHRWHDHECKRPGNEKYPSPDGQDGQPPSKRHRAQEDGAAPFKMNKECRALLKTSLLARRIPVENSVEQVRGSPVLAVPVDTS
eukprot:SAG22_NODE_163_length_16829_cov_9.946204_6_plen_231_part_00